MKQLLRISVSFIILGIMLFACQTDQQQSFQGTWLRGEATEVVAEIEHQFAGFSQTMWEVQYRYSELFWAGADENWEYADYQLEHIMEALEQGFVRRPEREPSSAQFVNQAAPALLKAIVAGDQQEFEKMFENMKNSCNTCHHMEDVAFITVVIPEVRKSVVRF